MIIWNTSPELLDFGFLHVRWYGLLFASGFLLGYWMMAWMCRREKVPTDSLDSLLIYMIVGTIVGARLGHCLFYEPEIYLADPIRILKVWEGGLASHGGALGVFTGTWLWKRKHFKGSLLYLVDLLTIPTAMVAGMIRVGNFFNSEILGLPTAMPWAVAFKRVDMVPRHPAQLYEALGYFLASALGFLIFKKGWHKGRNGLIFGFCFALMTAARFGIEFFKERQVAFENQLPLDLGQLLTIPFFFLSVFLFVRALRMAPAEPLKKQKKGAKA